MNTQTTSRIHGTTPNFTAKSFIRSSGDLMSKTKTKTKKKRKTLDRSVVLMGRETKGIVRSTTWAWEKLAEVSG